MVSPPSATCCFLALLIFDPEDGGDMFLRKEFTRRYTQKVATSFSILAGAAAGYGLND
jgi:hypothetical protein